MFARSLRLLTSHAPPRALHTAAARTSRAPARAAMLCTVPVTFVEDGEEINVDAEVGKTLLKLHMTMTLTWRVLVTGRWRARRAT